MIPPRQHQVDNPGRAPARIRGLDAARARITVTAPAADRAFHGDEQRNIHYNSVCAENDGLGNVLRSRHTTGCKQCDAIPDAPFHEKPVRSPQAVQHPDSILAATVHVGTQVNRLRPLFGEPQNFVLDVTPRRDPEDGQEVRIDPVRLLDRPDRVSIRLDLDHRRPFQRFAFCLQVSRAQSNHQVVVVLRVTTGVLIGAQGQVGRQLTGCKSQRGNDTVSGYERKRAEEDRDRDFPARGYERLQVPVRIELHVAQVTHGAAQMDRGGDMLPAMDAVACRPDNLGHVGPDVVIAVAIEETAVSGPTDGDLSRRCLFLERRDDCGSVDAVAEFQVFLARMHAQRPARALQNTGEAVPATRRLGVGHLARIGL